MDMIKTISSAILSVLLFVASGQTSSVTTSTQPPPWPQYTGHEVLRVYDYAAYFKLGIGLSAPDVLFWDSRGVLWVSGISSLYSYDEGENKWNAYPTSLTVGSLKWSRAVAEDGKGRIWVSYGVNRKYAYFDGERWRDAAELIPAHLGELKNTMVGGRDGKIWLISNLGVIAYDGQNWIGPFAPSVAIQRKFEDIPRKSDDPDWDRTKAQLQEKYGWKDKAYPWVDEVVQGLEDHESNIWLGTGKGIFRFSEKTKEWKLYPLPGQMINVSRIYEDRKGRLWFLDSAANVTVYDKDKDDWKLYNLTQKFPWVDHVDDVYQDRDQNIIFGTAAGLILFSELQSAWKVVGQLNNGDTIRFVSRIVEDRKGRLWLVTNKSIVILTS